MFVEAIERVNQFTRPIHFISRYYGGGEIVPGTATLFFVNELGFAVTCKHVAAIIQQGDTLYSHFLKFRAETRPFEKEKNYALHLRRLEGKYKMAEDTIVRLRSTFMNAVSDFTQLTMHLHPTADLAIIQFEGFQSTRYGQPAVFLRDGTQVKQGKTLCRLGYPFPEFSNYHYNKSLDDIEWNTTGRADSPSFPIDGIVTRLVGDPGLGRIESIELSTPGLRGQSGGPLFDTRGVVYGMQSSTAHLHLGFDQHKKEVMIGNKKQRVSNYPFLNVGRCVHVSVIKDFLRENNVKFYESD